MNADQGSPCVHCGLCLDACPTYRLTGLEAESPRGRLYLMDAIRNGTMPLGDDAVGHLDACLGCAACETACPSGVHYGARIAEFRPLLREAAPLWQRLLRTALGRTLRRPRWQRAAVAGAGALDRLGLGRLRRRIPGLDLVPDRQPPRGSKPRSRARRDPFKARARVLLLVGCGGRTFRPSLAAAAIRVLEENDIEVVLVPDRMCCGALAEHEGDAAAAQGLVSALARHVDEARVDYVVTAAAGCRAALGAAAGSTAAAAAGADAVARLSGKSREICELLVEVGFRPPQKVAMHSGEIAYHDACHLLHAARAPEPPRAVLAAIGTAVVDLGENAICCGSAGTYNLVHPRTASALGRRKSELVAAGAFKDVAVANLGCILQIERSLAVAGMLAATRVAHPIEYLAEAYEREDAPA